MESPTSKLLTLERLPTELLIEILSLSPDLSSLHSLLLASRIASSVFLTAARQILDAVISASLPPITQAAVRTVVHIRVLAHDLRGVDDVRTLARATETGAVFWREDAVPTSLPSKTAPALLRRCVALAHDIHSLAHACLESYLKKCLTLRPSRPPDMHFASAWNGHVLLPPREDGQLYEIPAQEPPRWVEEQRVLRAFWLVQAFYEVQRARLDGRLLAWTEDEIPLLQGLSTSDLFGFGGHLKEQILTVTEFLDTLSDEGSGWRISAFRMPRSPPCADQENRFHLACAPELHFAFNEDKWGQGWHYVTWPSRGWRFYRRMVSDFRCTLESLRFDPYRRHGFAIWDDKRLVSLGFSTGDRKHDLVHNPYSVYFVWLSILADEEMEEHLAAQRALWKRTEEHGIDPFRISRALGYRTPDQDGKKASE